MSPWPMPSADDYRREVERADEDSREALEEHDRRAELGPEEDD